MENKEITLRERIVITLLLCAARIIHKDDLPELDVYFRNAMRNQK